MSNATTRVKYDDLKLIARKLHAESEEYAALQSVTRRKLNSLRHDWSGRAADSFFNEMDGKLLPAMHRLSEALLVSESTLEKIMQTIYEADMETTTYFKGFDATVASSGNTQPPVYAWQGGLLPIAAGGASWLPAISLPLAVTSWRTDLPAWLRDWVNHLFSDAAPPTVISPVAEIPTPTTSDTPRAGSFGDLLARSAAESSPSAKIQNPPEQAPALSAPAPNPVTETPAAPKYDVFYDVPVKAQGAEYKNAACALTSVSMVLDYFHNKDASYVTATPETLKTMLEPGDGTEGKGVALHLMTDDLGELGYKTITVKVDASLGDLETSLKNGPVIVTAGVKLVGGDARDITGAGSSSHAMVVTGLNADSVVLNDPWSGTEKIFSRDVFEKMWKNGQRGMYVIQP